MYIINKKLQGFQNFCILHIIYFSVFPKTFQGIFLCEVKTTSKVEGGKIRPPSSCASVTVGSDLCEVVCESWD